MLEAIKVIDKEISKVKPEHSEDEAAYEWLGHLEDVKEQLNAGTMTVSEASSSLGIYLE